MYEVKTLCRVMIQAGASAYIYYGAMKQKPLLIGDSGLIRARPCCDREKCSVFLVASEDFLYVCQINFEKSEAALKLRATAVHY